MLDVIDSYQEKYESSLIDDISGDVSGDYGLILTRILKGTDAAVAETEENGDGDGEEEWIKLTM